MRHAELTTQLRMRTQTSDKSRRFDNGGLSAGVAPQLKRQPTNGVRVRAAEHGKER